MKRNIYGMAAVGAIAVFMLTACMAPRTQGGAQGSVDMGPQALGPGGVQGHAPYGADPESHHHLLAENR